MLNKIPRPCRIRSLKILIFFRYVSRILGVVKMLTARASRRYPRLGRGL